MEWFIVCKSFNFVVIILCRFKLHRRLGRKSVWDWSSRFALCSNYLYLAKVVLLHLRLKSPLSRFCLCRICLKLAQWFSRFFIKCLPHWWLLKTIHIVHVQTHFNFIALQIQILFKLKKAYYIRFSSSCIYFCCMDDNPIAYTYKFS